MSNNAMSNETALDWLARNVHKWPEGKREVLVCWPRNVATLIWSYVSSDAGWITKAQWLARRAELQNKPGWKGAPEWAEWLAQDEDGEWKWLGSNPSKYIDGWTANKLSCCKKIRSYGAVIEKGTILGDWRDTLEKRPEDFKPFTSIEDNQEQDMAQQQEMKQDNGWFERGELPPVGTECEIDLGAKWRKAFVVGRNYTGRIVVEIDTCDFIVADGCTFRPIPTERDVLIEIIKKTDDTDDKIADAILAAGFKRGAA